MFVYISRGIKLFPSRCPLDKQDCSVEIYFAFSLASNSRFYVLLAAVWRLTHNLYSFAKYSKQNICPRLNLKGDMYTFLKCVCACVCMRIDMGSLWYLRNVMQGSCDGAQWMCPGYNPGFSWAGQGNKNTIRVAMVLWSQWYARQRTTGWLMVLGRVPRQDSAHSESLKGTGPKGGQGEVMIALAKSLIKAV